MTAKPTYEALRRRVEELEAERHRFRNPNIFLCEGEAQYENLFRNNQAVMLVIDPETARIIDANPAACAFYGYPPETLRSMKITDINRSRTAEELFGDMAKAREQTQTRFAFRHRLSDGEIREVEVFSGPVALGGRRVLLSIIHDTSERRDTEAALRRQQESLRRLTHDLKERVKELKCLYDISKLVEKSDTSMADILARTVRLIPPAWQYPEITGARIELGDLLVETERYRPSPWRQTAEIVVGGRMAGRVTVCYVEQRPPRDEGAFVREERDLLEAIAERLGRIAERKRAETALRESEERFRTLVENAMTGISIVQDGRVVYENPEHGRLWGSPRHGRPPFDLAAIDPDDVEEVRRRFERIGAGEVRTLDMEFRIRPDPDGGGRRKPAWIHCRTSVIDYGGEDSLLVNLMDMTRAKELEHLLRIQEKMSALGRVAAGIAHEIRNPLSGINIYANTLRRHLENRGDPAASRHILHQIEAASNRIESVIKRVLDFSKPHPPRFARTEINAVIQEAMRLSESLLKKNGIETVVDLPDDLPDCSIDPQLMEVVLLNLITNAAQALEGARDPKTIRIRTRMEKGHLLVDIADSGPGIPPGVKDKIFDPFYTTKTDTTGIGLSICHRIIKDHGGCLRVSESESGGAEFTIELLAHGPSSP